MTPARSRIPAQATIRRRFAALYPGIQGLAPLIAQFAAEAESMLLEQAARKTVTIAQRRGRKTGYTCPSCRAGGMHTDYRYCPCCGAAVEWRRVG